MRDTESKQQIRSSKYMNTHTQMFACEERFSV